MALPKHVIDIVKSTAPILEVHGVTITSVFYKNMFSNHPELLNIFNHANQSQGRQQTALANMVYMAAKNIDRLEELLPAVTQVAYKHRGLGVKPEHYPIVGKHLLEAIKEVLGDSATDEIINAWAEAYGEIAQVFINIEANMYRKAEEQEGGWEDFKDFVVVDKVKESEVITSFYLKAKDGKPVPAYKPGQYITIRVHIPDETYALNRQYSLSVAPGNEYFRISVKKEAEFVPNGKVSNYLHHNIQDGDTVEVSAPAGDFYLDVNAEDHVALISGGVGLTPMMSMLETLVQNKTSQKVTFIHSARNEAVHAFAEEASKLVSVLDKAEYIVGYDKPLNISGNHDFTGYISKDLLQAKIDKNTVCYICGPVPFLKNVVSMLTDIGVEEENIRYEFFGPALQLDTKVTV